MELIIEAEKKFISIECYTCPSDDKDECGCYNQCGEYNKDCGCNSGHCGDWN